MAKSKLGTLIGWVNRESEGAAVALERGDEARGRGDWSSAAEHYRRHLRSRPEAFPIWVQLGHAYKEGGKPVEALAAYEKGLDLNPGDADLLLQLGHAHKVMGDLETAKSFYRRSAEVDGNDDALAELLRIDARSGWRPDATRGSVRTSAIDIIANGCEGVRPTDVSSIIPDANGQGLELTSDDSWVSIKLEGSKYNTSALGFLSIQSSRLDGGEKIAGKLYFDRGHGFEEKYSLRLAGDGGTARIAIVSPASIMQLRWDPDDKPGRVTAPRLTYDPSPAPSEAQLAICGAKPHRAQNAILARIIGIVFSQQTMDYDEACRLTIILSGAGDSVRNIESQIYYKAWLELYETPVDDDYAVIEALTSALKLKPKFSFVMPTYNTPPALLRECMDSMLSQTYYNLEVCVADDNSTDSRVMTILDEYAARDSRVKVCRRSTNGHISAASNSALSLATGDFVVLIDHDDLIVDWALFVIAYYINQRPSSDILYSDEDKIDLEGRRSMPYFKAEFNKFLMYGHNMVSHLGVFRRSLIEAAGGFRLTYEGSQDYDLFLRCYERSADDRIVHIPHVLYHWRLTPGSTAISADQKSYAIVAAQGAINGHFERTGMPFRSVETFAPGNTGIAATREFQTSLTIIIPTRNGLDLLKPCIDSILAAPHEGVEILIVDNGSDDPATLKYLERISDTGLAKIIRDAAPFNFSELNNGAARQATGEILCFLNNDTEVIAPKWLARARALLSLEDVGAVGARLLYPDYSLQHFGVTIGMGDNGVAGVPHTGLSQEDPGYFSKARLIQEFSAVTAACLFVRKTDFDAVGGFEPDLPVAYNDVDLCLKLRGRGLRVVADPEILLIHKESRTRGSDKDGGKRARLDKEGEWMIRRWSREFLFDDPFYSPNHSLRFGDFRLAATPRVSPPWRREAAAKTCSAGI
jgi:glycosyltransferase involved in cell wall biosynthesis/tetratricopeptide (TPR) repeat protein